MIWSKKARYFFSFERNKIFSRDQNPQMGQEGKTRSEVQLIICVWETEVSEDACREFGLHSCFPISGDKPLLSAKKRSFPGFWTGNQRVQPHVYCCHPLVWATSLRAVAKEAAAVWRDWPLAPGVEGVQTWLYPGGRSTPRPRDLKTDGRIGKAINKQFKISLLREIL